MGYNKMLAFTWGESKY